MLENENTKKIIASIVLVVVLLTSIFVAGNIATKPETYSKYYKVLDEKRNNVTTLVAAVAGSSAAIAMIPGDATTPVANEIASLSKYLIVVIGAIILEKLLLTAIGGLSFKILLPIACALGIVALFVKNEWIKKFAIKLGVISVVIVCIVPLSIKVSDAIEKSSEINLEQNIAALADNKDLEENKKTEDVKKDKNLISGIVSGTKDVVSNVGNKLNTKTKEVGNKLNMFIQQITVLIITSCVIPILVLMGFIWVVKLIFSIQIPTKQVTDFIKKDTFKSK